MKTMTMIRMARTFLALVVGLSVMVPRAGAFSFSFWGTITDVNTGGAPSIYGISLGDTFSGTLLFYPDTSTGGIFQQGPLNPYVPALLQIRIGDSYWYSNPLLPQYLSISDGETEDKVWAWGEGPFHTGVSLTLIDSLGLALDSPGTPAAWNISEWTRGFISIADLPDYGNGRIEGTIAGTPSHQIPDAGSTIALLGLGLAGLVILDQIRRKPAAG